MLEYEALAIGTDGALRDARTGAPAGTATVRAPLKWLFGRFAPVALIVREEPDGALVFTARRGWGPFARWFDVLDAAGARLGSVSAHHGQLLVANRTDDVFADATPSGAEWRFRTTEGDELGTGGRVVRPAPRFADDPPAKMLLLAANLVALLLELPQLPTGSD